MKQNLYQRAALFVVIIRLTIIMTSAYDYDYSAYDYVAYGNHEYWCNLGVPILVRYGIAWRDNRVYLLYL